MQIAREFTKDHTVLVAVIHDINLAIQFADQLYFLKEGKLVANGWVKQILSADLIKDVFNVDVFVMENPVNNKPLVVYIH